MKVISFSFIIICLLFLFVFESVRRGILETKDSLYGLDFV